MGSDESHLMFHSLWGTKSQDSVHKPQLFWRERRAERYAGKQKGFRESTRGPSAYQPNALPLGQTGSLSKRAHLGMREMQHEWKSRRCWRKIQMEILQMKHHRHCKLAVILFRLFVCYKFYLFVVLLFNF